MKFKNLDYFLEFTSIYSTLIQEQEVEMALYESDIREILKYYLGIVDFYKKEIENGPPGNLVYQNSKGYDQFLHLYRDQGKLIRRGINQDEPLQRALAQKEFARKALEVLEPNVKLLEKALTGIIPFDPDAILASMTKGYAKLPEEYFFDRTYLECDLHLPGERAARIARHSGWKEEPYEKNHYHDEDKKIRTSRGEWVRSKSETLILEKCYRDEIEVHYEQVQVINDIVIVPDFTFQGADGRLFYWEHVGLLDDYGYAVSNYEKLKRYYYAGLVPGANLILTFERHGSIDMGFIEAIFEHEVIPRL